MITYQNAIDLYNAVKMHTVNNIGIYDIAYVCNNLFKTNYDPSNVSLKDLHDIYAIIDDYAMNASYMQLSSLYMQLREVFSDPDLLLSDRNGNPITLQVMLPESPALKENQEIPAHPQEETNLADDVEVTDSHTATDKEIMEPLDKARAKMKSMKNSKSKK